MVLVDIQLIVEYIFCPEKKKSPSAPRLQRTITNKPPNTDTPIMDYLVRFAQTHETFRVPELEACATLAGAEIEILSYNKFV